MQPEPVEHLIPHCPPMRWLDDLVECTETAAVAVVRLTEGHFALADGKLLESALVECAAQTVAAALGKRRQLAAVGGPPPQGMLAAISNFRLLRRPVTGAVLRITVREIKRLGPMLLVAASIAESGEVIASGELSLYV
jgi:predicted hotdog family 3-hydroxylacyl-ACP dehydratase